MLSADSSFDLAVIGAGPAGSSAAITAARPVPPLCCAKREPSRVTRCAENSFRRKRRRSPGITQRAAIARALFEKVPASTAPACSWALARRRLRFPCRSQYFRYDLDEHCGWPHRPRGQITQIVRSRQRRQRTIRVANLCRHVRGQGDHVAAGRWSQFTPNRHIPPGPKWMGVKAHFRERHPSRSTDLYFFPHGYCGVQPVADDIVNASAMVRSDQAKSLPQVFALHAGLAERTGKWTTVTTPVSTAPLIYRKPQPSTRQHPLRRGCRRRSSTRLSGTGSRSPCAAGVWPHNASSNSCPPNPPYLMRQHNMSKSIPGNSPRSNGSVSDACADVLAGTGQGGGVRDTTVTGTHALRHPENAPSSVIEVP